MTVNSKLKSDEPLALIMKGGGIKGLAYVGAIDILARQYNFNWFIGTSAGAITAILLGAGYSAEELKEILQSKNFQDFFDAKWYQKPSNLIFRHGLHPAETFTSWLDDLLAKKLNSITRVKMSDLPNRVTVYASRRGMSVLKFDSNDSDADAAYAARCSMSIPWIFTPQSDQGIRAYDGGIQNNYPVEELLKEHPETPFISLFLGSEVYEPVKQKSVLADLISIVTESSEPETVKKYREKTVIIDPRPIGTLDFSLSDDEKDFLLLAGQTGALAHLDKDSVEYNSTKQKRDETKNRVVAMRNKSNTKRFWIRVFLLIICLTIFGYGVWKLGQKQSETTTTVSNKTNGTSPNIVQSSYNSNETINTASSDNLNSSNNTNNSKTTPSPNNDLNKFSQNVSSNQILPKKIPSEFNLKKTMDRIASVVRLEGGQGILVRGLEERCYNREGDPGDQIRERSKKILNQVKRIKIEINSIAPNKLVLDKQNLMTYRQLILDLEEREDLLNSILSKKSSNKNLNPDDLCKIAEKYWVLKERLYELAYDYYRYVLESQEFQQLQ